MNARKILQAAIFALTIFLTGCATQRYHSFPGAHPPSGAGTTAPSFRWPLEGRVVTPYGARQEGVSLKGIVLEGAEGGTVRAAEGGRVAFVDESLRGYGKTLILEHDGAFSTVYAGSAEILVAPGQEVKQGEPIARVGRAGKGAAPRLYFELRRLARPEDPLRYLR